ncbi:MAG: hypothetical protein EZS28_029433, partial [Streblomastix strix]
QLGEILKTLTIHPGSFSISKQQFTDQLVTQLTSSGVKYTRAPLGARGLATCSMVQTCQVNWTITIPANISAIQLNETNIEDNQFKRRINFNGSADSQAVVAKSMTQAAQKYYRKQAEGFENSDRLRFWLGFSTACGPFHQFQLKREATTLQGTSIYARELTAISSNSLSDLCTSNIVSVSPLESIIAGKCHCEIFIDILLYEIDKQCDTSQQHFKIPFDIAFSGVLNLNQQNPILNSFPVLTRNQASLFLQLWIKDYLQDLKVIWLKKTDTVRNQHLAYHMIPFEKSEIVYLLAEPTAQAIFAYKKFNVRIVIMQNAAVGDRGPQNSISQINNARFEKLEIQNICFNVKNEEAKVNLIRNCFETSEAMQIIDQRHVVPQPYEALTQTVNGLMFDCFIDQDVVSAPSDLYHSFTFENINCQDKGDFYGNGEVNVFAMSTLFEQTKVIKTPYPNKYMLA